MEWLDHSLWDTMMKKLWSRQITLWITSRHSSQCFLNSRGTFQADPIFWIFHSCPLWRIEVCIFRLVLNFTIWWDRLRFGAIMNHIQAPLKWIVRILVLRCLLRLEILKRCCLMVCFCTNHSRGKDFTRLSNSLSRTFTFKERIRSTSRLNSSRKKRRSSKPNSWIRVKQKPREQQVWQYQSLFNHLSISWPSRKLLKQEWRKIELNILFINNKNESCKKLFSLISPFGSNIVLVKGVRTYGYIWNWRLKADMVVWT